MTEDIDTRFAEGFGRASARLILIGIQMKSLKAYLSDVEIGVGAQGKIEEIMTVLEEAEADRVEAAAKTDELIAGLRGLQ